MRNTIKRIARIAVTALAVLPGICVPMAAAEAARPLVHQVFTSHMVIQRDALDPVWGWTAAGNTVTVVVNDENGSAIQTKTAVARADGRWQVEVGPFGLVAGHAAYCVSVSAPGEATTTLTDVLIGDVFVCSGQSNMEFGIQKDADAAESIRTATDSKIRMFFVPWATALTPQSGFATTREGSLDGKWQVCSPDVLNAPWAWNGFSAVGYYFARDLRKSAGVPIGMIAAYKGGSPAESWTSVDGLKKDPQLAHHVAAHEKIVANWEAVKAAYPQLKAAAETKWRSALAKWENSDAKERESAARPVLSLPDSPDGGFGAPGNLFNGMISPLLPYVVKGVIWYQGESNADNMDEAREYATLFPNLIEDWRKQWGSRDLPFLFVQLASFKSHPRNAVEEAPWPILREAQSNTLKLPNTGMASAVDVGDANDIHPIHKSSVGKRLALVARHVVYGEEIVCSGPVFLAMEVMADKARIQFKKQLGSALVIGDPPWTPDGVIHGKPRTLDGFAMAGEDHRFVSARAELSGDCLTLTSPEVKHPVAVRYNWAMNPVGNLYNPEGLPAPPFRSDSW
jgi:sialate O-acetylesterase